MSKPNKKNIFSNNPWHDTLYYDFVIDEWMTFGNIDTLNSIYRIIDKKDFNDNQLTFSSNIFVKWTERI